MTAFRSIAKRKEDYPKWFAEGKTRLSQGYLQVFASENQRPVVHSMSPQPMDKHFGDYELMDEQQRGAKNWLHWDRGQSFDCPYDHSGLSQE